MFSLKSREKQEAGSRRLEENGKTKNLKKSLDNIRVKLMNCSERGLFISLGQKMQCFKVVKSYTYVDIYCKSNMKLCELGINP